MKSWILGTNPVGIFAHSCVLANPNQLLIIGGSDEEGKLTNLIQVFNFEKVSFDSIDPKNDLTARQFHSNVFHNNNIYIFGGKSGSYKNDVVVIDVSSKCVSTISTSGTKPSPRFGHGSCVWNNIMFVYGGYDTDSATTTEMYQLDLATMTWSVVNTKGNLLPGGRYLFGSCVLGNYWYIFGGNSGVSPYNDVWSFEFETSTWREIKCHGKWPSPRWACTLAGISSAPSSDKNESRVDELYVFGGKTKNKVLENNELFRLELNTGEWTRIKLKELSRYYHTCVVQNSQLIIIGGSTKEKNAESNLLCIDLPSIRNIGLLSSLWKPGASKAKSFRSDFDVLPFETFMEVLSHLDAIDLIRCSRVSRFWYKHTQNEDLWRTLWETKYKHKGAIFQGGTYVGSLYFLRNLKATDAQNRADFNLVKWYNEWAEYHNIKFSNGTQEHLFYSRCNTKDLPTKNFTSNRYKGFVLIYYNFGTEECDKKALAIQNLLRKKNLGDLWNRPQPDNARATLRYIGKMVVVGDHGVGKTCYLQTLTTGEFPAEYIPTYHDNFDLSVVWNRIPFTISLWDTHTSEDFDRLRPLQYVGSTFLALFYSITTRTSFENIKIMCNPEVQRHCPHVPKVLVATKCDLREDQSTIERLAERKDKMITTEEGEALAKEIGAVAFVEISSLSNKNLFRVLEEGIHHILQDITFDEDNNDKKCSVM